MDAASAKWEEGLPDEISLWEDWLDGHTENAEERAYRLSSNRPFPTWAKPLIPAQVKEFRVLDVGAGPVTAIGDVWRGRKITVVPIDPLAETFAQRMEEYAITLPNPTIYGIGEELEKQFGKDSFHLAYARNCLDRSMDPVECFRQVLAVLKPGCSFVTFHDSNEAERHNYEGLHQWNFSVKTSRLVVWNHSGDWDIMHHCPEADHYRIETDSGHIKFTLTKKA
jgi:SAM-dependent methyltransferase